MQKLIAALALAALATGAQAAQTYTFSAVPVSYTHSPLSFGIELTEQTDGTLSGSTFGATVDVPLTGFTLSRDSTTGAVVGFLGSATKYADTYCSYCDSQPAAFFTGYGTTYFYGETFSTYGFYLGQSSSGTLSLTQVTAAVPEPSNYGLLGAGLLLLVKLAGRRKVTSPARG